VFALVTGLRALLFSEEAKVAMKLYVGNLSFEITNTALEELFQEHGSVRSAQVIMDRETGRSKGFGFVEMTNDQEAREAITSLNGQQLNGRSLTVNEARPREDRGVARTGVSGRR
jgi:RNA recognition motif-containing protein